MEQVKDRSVEFSNRFRLVNVADGSTLGIFDLDEITGEIYEIGTPIDAKLFDSINEDILKCVAKVVLDGTTLIFEDKDGNKLDTVDLSTLTFDVELENYYTKAETDALISSEKERAETKENSLAENITAGIAEAKEYTDDETRRAQKAEKVNSDLIAATAKELDDEITRAKLVEGDIIADTDTELNKCVTEITLDETLYALNLKNKNDADIGSVDLMPLASSTGSVSILYTETPELYQIVTISYAQWAEISRTPAKAVHINDNVYASNGYIYNVYNNNYIANDTNNIQLRCTYVPVNHGEVTAAVNTEKERAQTVENSLSDRITTAQDTADEAESIARGRSQARVFDTVEDMLEWLTNEENIAVLNIGDNLYIKEIDVPDYWWNGDGASPLEAEKPDLTQYYTKTQTDSKIDEAKTEANSYTDIKVAEETEAREGLTEDTINAVQELQRQITDAGVYISQVNNKVSADAEKIAVNEGNIDNLYEEIGDINSKKYEKPDLGIPKPDLTIDVQASLDKADTALQSFTETDPTVPDWAKQPQKPTYTADEIGALTLQAIVDILYPVGGGERYIQFPNAQTPAEKFPNTSWEIDTEMQGKTIIGSGGTYTLGATGGSANAVVVEHSHILVGSGGDTINTMLQTANDTIAAYKTGNGDLNYSLYKAEDEPWKGKSGVTGESGSGKNMPPYLVVNFWKRTA